ncbi:MAG: 50S ribosomal protein L15 [Alphaproteobacteria bacterium]|jgi:large subunit ribosomal protein L15
MIKMNMLKDNPGARYQSKRRGRGIGSGKGKTCGVGGKGQTARSGVAIKGFEGGQTPIHVRLPKRGFNNVNRSVIEIINLQDIERLVEAKRIKSGDVIDREKLVNLGLITNTSHPVKVLGSGDLKNKLKFQLDFYSESAKRKITEAGSEILA